MKYILEEKYLLDERYILVEKTTPDHINTLGQCLKNYKDTIDSLLNKIDLKNNKSNKIVTEIQNVLNNSSTITTEAQFNERKTLLLNTLDELSPSWKTTYPDINKNITNAKLSDLTAPFMQAALKDCIDILKNINITDTAISIIKSLNENISKRLDWLNQIKKANKSVQDNVRNEIAIYVKNKDKIKNILKNDITKDLSTNDIDKLNKDCNEINEMLGFADETASSESGHESPADESANYDWTSAYRNITSKEQLDAFWQRYYEIVWKNNEVAIKFLKKIEPAFVREVHQYGFTEFENPFISYIKKFILANNARPNKISYEQFGIIHNNHFGSKMITDKDLRGEGNLGESNLIFNDRLFEQTALDINEYLKIQYNFIKALSGQDTNNTLRDNITTEFIKNGIDPTNKAHFKSIFNEFFFEASDVSGAAGADSKKLCTILRLKQKWKEWFTGEIEERITPTIELIKKAAKMANIACFYLLINYYNAPDDIKTIFDAVGLTQPDSIGTQNLLDCKKLFKDYTISSDNVIDLVKKIANEANSSGGK